MSDININVNVDATKGIKNIESLNKTMDQLSETVDDVGKVTDDSLGNLTVTISGSAEEIVKYQKELAKTGKEAEDLGESGKKSSKGLGMIGTAFKGIGTAFKAMGIGAVVALFMSLWEAAKKNQAVMDAIDLVMTSVSLVFQKITDTLVGVYKSVSEATGGFDAMKAVIGGLIKIAITPLKLSFFAIQGAVLGAQLAWEKSFLGGKDPEKIKELNASLKEVKDNVVQTTKESIEAGKQVGRNIGEAIGEVSLLVKTGYKDLSKTIGDITIDGLSAQAKLINQGTKDIAKLDIMLQRQMLISQRNAELQRQVRDDETKSIDERIAANDELGKILEQQAAAEIALINTKIGIKQAELAANKGNVDIQNEILQLENDRLDVQERITGMKSEQMANENALRKEGAEQEAEQLQKSLDQIAANNEFIKNLYRKTAEEKLAITRDELLAELELLTLTEEEKIAAKKEIEEQYREGLAELKQEEQDALDEQAERDKERDKEVYDEKINNLKAYLANVMQVNALISSLLDLKFQNERNQLDKARQAELDAAKGNAEKIDEINIKYARKKADLEYEQAKTKKAQSILDALIGTAVAVATALPNIPLSVLAGALGTAQVAVIAATPIPKPQYARGGVLQGPSHANGGITTPFGEMEGGEGIINKNSMSNPSLRNIASSVNVAGGGVSFGSGDGTISLSQDSIVAIVSGINNKKVILNTNELNQSNKAVALIDSESKI